MKSIDAYDLKGRVAKYDKEMDIMHPNRPKMVNIGLEFLPFNQDQQIKVLDLGVGTGFFTQKLLQKFTNAQVVALDGAQLMIDLAKARLEDFEKSIKYVVGDFRDIDNTFDNKKEIFDVVISSFAFHHLSFEEKKQTFKKVHDLLKNGGWMINADCIVDKNPLIEQRFQEKRVEGIVVRAKGQRPFDSSDSTRKYLDRREAEEKDNPLTIEQELQAFEFGGFKNISILWKEYREAVCCGQK